MPWHIKSTILKKRKSLTRRISNLGFHDSRQKNKSSRRSLSSRLEVWKLPNVNQASIFFQLFTGDQRRRLKWKRFQTCNYKRHEIEKKRVSKHSVLKITEKSHFTTASEASYVYILSGEKLIKNAKNSPYWGLFLGFIFRVHFWSPFFWEFWKPEAWTIEMRDFRWFSNNMSKIQTDIETD